MLNSTFSARPPSFPWPSSLWPCSRPPASRPVSPALRCPAGSKLQRTYHLPLYVQFHFLLRNKIVFRLTNCIWFCAPSCNPYMPPLRTQQSPTVLTDVTFFWPMTEMYCPIFIFLFLILCSVVLWLEGT